MRIAIDVTDWQDARGFGRFTRELVSQLVHDHGTTHDVVLITDRSTAARTTFPAGARVCVVDAGHQSPGHAAMVGARHPLVMLALGWHTARSHPDVVFFPSPATYYPVLGRVPVVVAMHDVMTQEHPERFFLTRRARALWKLKMWLMRRQVAAFVTPSENARVRVASALSWPLDRITCIHEAPAAIFANGQIDDVAIGAALAQHLLPATVPLVLYVGGLDPHKNLSNLLRAMALIHPTDSGAWHLVLVGAYHTARAATHAEELLALRDALGLQARVTFTGFVPDETLVQFYHAASVLVLPSFDEGFGLPVVEAMACGLPVAVSDRGSLPDLAGDAGVTFDPDDPSAIAHAIRVMLDDPELRRTLGRRGVERAKAYSWQRSAMQLVHVLRSVTRRVS